MDIRRWSVDDPWISMVLRGWRSMDIHVLLWGVLSGVDNPHPALRDALTVGARRWMLWPDPFKALQWKCLSNWNRCYFQLLMHGFHGHWNNPGTLLSWWFSITRTMIRWPENDREGIAHWFLRASSKNAIGNTWQLYLTWFWDFLEDSTSKMILGDPSFPKTILGGPLFLPKQTSK